MTVGQSTFTCVDPRTAATCGAHGRSLAIEWPPAVTLLQIESLLALRPAPENRNWEPFETIDDLQAENAAHGIA